MQPVNIPQTHSYLPLSSAEEKVDQKDSSNMASCHHVNDETSALMKNLEGVQKEREQIQATLRSLTNSLEVLSKKEQEILQRLDALSNLSKEEKVDSAQNDLTIEVSQNQNCLIERVKKICKISESILVVKSDEMDTYTDSHGIVEHYPVYVLGSNGNQTKVSEFPIDEKKFGKIGDIILDDGCESRLLQIDSDYMQNLIAYFTTDFETYRTELNKEKITNGTYLNKYVPFDCQRFAFSVKFGEEGSFYRDLNKRIAVLDYRDHALLPGNFYCMVGEKADYGNQGTYSLKSVSMHYFFVLAHDLVVSKLGGGGVFFQSLNQMKAVYYPSDFIKGYVRQV